MNKQNSIIKNQRMSFFAYLALTIQFMNLYSFSYSRKIYVYWLKYIFDKTLEEDVYEIHFGNPEMFVIIGTNNRDKQKSFFGFIQ